MISVLLRAPNPASDFEWIAALISSVAVDPTSVNELREWYEHKLGYIQIPGTCRMEKSLSGKE